MENMLNYIFGTLKYTEIAVKDINKFLKRQNGINKRNALFAVATVGWIYMADKRYRLEREELEKRIETQENLITTLGAEVRVLKSEKGEAQM